MARRAELARRVARTTALVVGEGHAEVALVKHLRGLYTAGNAGFAVTAHNARGFGVLPTTPAPLRTLRARCSRKRAGGSLRLMRYSPQWAFETLAPGRPRAISARLV